MKKQAKPFGERVRDLRTSRGWTTRQLAEKAGVSQGAVSHLETGRRAPSLDLAQRVAAALGTTLNDLTGEKS